MLEKGGYAAERDFTHQEGDAYRDLYLYGLTLTTDDLACRILAGSTWAGARWSLDLVPDPAGGAGRVGRGVGRGRLRLRRGRRVTGGGRRPARGHRGPEPPRRRDRLLEQGLERLGWHAGPLPRNVRDCPQDAGCGWCGFGCRHGAKQSTLVTYLEDAAAAGARLVVGADARRVLVEDGRATGLEAVAGGTGWSSGRGRWWPPPGPSRPRPCCSGSGLGGQVGRNLRLHPGTAAVGEFPEPVRWWEGPCRRAGRPPCASAGSAWPRPSSRRCPCTRERPRSPCPGGRPPPTGP